MEGFGKYVVLAGFNNVKFIDVTELFDDPQREGEEACVQFFDASTIAGREHLFFAALNSVASFRNQTNVSHRLGVETLLFTSAQRQIRKAVELFGVKAESSQVAVLIIANTAEEAMETLETVEKKVPGDPDNSVIELTDDKIEIVKKLFDISNLEIEAKLRSKGVEREAVIDLVIEHVALLAIQG